jgi:hypothetical protein
VEQPAIEEGVRVFDVSVEGPVVNVAVYGGQDNVCGSVRFTFHDAEERQDHLRRLRAWAQQAVPLFLVADGERASLSPL